MKEIIAAAAAIVLLSAAAASSQEAQQAPRAVLRVLDTIAGRVSELEVAVGEPSIAGRLQIIVDECRYLPENPATNSYAHVRIMDRHSRDVLHGGWLIASAPALSAMDHSRYDVWLIRCSTAEVASPEG